MADFGKLLKMPYKKLDFYRNVGFKKLTELTMDEQEMLLWSSGLLGQSQELAICFHHELNAFQRRAITWVLGSHQHKVMGKKAISPLMARHPKDKELNADPEHSLSGQCIKKYTTIQASKIETESEVENTNEKNDDDTDKPDNC